ncbi:DUF6493 family protein [Rhizobacter sp. P5_C2]
MAARFMPSTALERHLHAGEVEAGLDCMRAMTPAERRAQRASVLAVAKLAQLAHWAALGSPSNGSDTWGHAPTPAQRHLVDAALMVCCTAKDVAAMMVDTDAVLPIAREFRPPALEGLGEALMGFSPNRIDQVQTLMLAGLIERPGADCDDYTLGLMSLPRRAGFRNDLPARFAADPGLAGVLLRMFEIEGTSEVSLAGIDKYLPVEQCWVQVLADLCEQGALERAVLIDRTLAALARDWPQFRSGWFCAFHAKLAPSAQELRANLDRYLALCSSRIPPTVTLALDAIKRIDAAAPIAPQALMAALQPVFGRGSKGQVEAALRLCEQIDKRAPALKGALARLACDGLFHESAELQKKLLQRIEAWGVDDGVRAGLQRQAPGIAASNRAQLSALTGADEGVPRAAPMVSSVQQQVVGVLDDSRRLPPIDGLHALVERIAFVFENDTEVDEFERVLDALVRAAPLDDAARALLAPVRKRVPKLRTPVARELGRLLMFVCDGTRTASTPVVDHGGNESPAHGGLIARIDALMAQAAQGRGWSPLSAPTHRRGIIDPQVLAQRLQAHAAAGLQPDPLELQLASLRVPAPALAITGPMPAFSWHVHSTSHTYLDTTYHHHHLQVDALPARTADTGSIAQDRRAPAVERARRHYRWWSFAGIDEAMIRYSATLVPGEMETFFAEGALALGNNLDWSEAQWQNRAWLLPLLDDTVAIGPMALLVLALALAGKDPGQTALAIDALVATHADERLPVDAFAATLRDLLATPLVKPPRLRKSFDAALRAAPAFAAPLIDVLGVALKAAPGTVPLLELLHELLLQQGQPLPAPVREALQAGTFSGRAKALQKQLLALG